MSAHEAHEKNINSIMSMIHGMPPSKQEERERLMWLLVGIHAGALTPVSENEKRGMERVLAILDRKIAEGGGSTDDAHNRFYRGRWSAFQECALMLRHALKVSNSDTFT
jgi:16S rRNA G1207 methylase RsmC